MVSSAAATTTTADDDDGGGDSARCSSTKATAAVADMEATAAAMAPVLAAADMDMAASELFFKCWFLLLNKSLRECATR